MPVHGVHVNFESNSHCTFESESRYHHVYTIGSIALDGTKLHLHIFYGDHVTIELTDPSVKVSKAIHRFIQAIHVVLKTKELGY